MAFIVFEGLDASGKSSLMRFLSEELVRRGVPHRVSREPGGTPLGEEIRTLLLRKDFDEPTPRTELLLYEAIRAQHVARVIRPALELGEWVLCDRYTASTVAFQSGGRGLEENVIQWLNHFATAGLEPDLNVLLDLPVGTSLERQSKRSQETGQGPDRFESEEFDFHESVRRSYLDQSFMDRKRWFVLDASQSPERLGDLLIHELETRKWLASSKR